MKRLNCSIDEMVQVNSRQADFYDEIQVTADAERNRGYEANHRANPLTRLWAALRHRQQNAAALAGIDAMVKTANLEWIHSNRHSAVLELGCFSGSQLTLELMQLADYYQGIDLSKVAIAALQRKVDSLGLNRKVSLKAGDFLTMEADRKFDVIYAHGVLHHFANPRVLFDKLAKLSNPNGHLVFVEPSACNVLYRTLRLLYRPFQSDALWEWPFTLGTVAALSKHFAAVDGFGWGRYTLPLSIVSGLPLLGHCSTKIYCKAVAWEASQRWHSRVWRNSTVTALYRLNS